ncbi:MAG: hypothetical protein GF330_03435, partial [Candidatus Eisenbacteria bacterium]|nr:hypothetical protein [Candidatus Eisenbacteria bacterium]
MYHRGAAATVRRHAPGRRPHPSDCCVRPAGAEAWMLGDMEPRYRWQRALRQHGDRLVGEAADSLTGSTVILKCDRFAYIQREMQTLLALPPGVGPVLRDASWTPERRLVLVLERLSGRTLSDAASTLTSRELPWIIGRLCQCLEALHRAGFVYADLRPENIFLLDAPQHVVPRDVRLLDFGATLTRVSDPREDATVGGTPELWAPEVARGWSVDGRADQYALGQMLRRLAPHLARDRAWGGLIERLTQPRAGDRFSDMAAARRALREAFGEAVPRAETPQLGAG